MRSQDAWYLATDFPVGELVFDDRGAVKAGTIRGLVARLTAHVQYDNAFFQAFLLTFRSFVNIDELVELLIERYNITAPPDLTPDQIKEWTLRKQTPVRLR
jgi:son of sevenless-like protein